MGQYRAADVIRVSEEIEVCTKVLHRDLEWQFPEASYSNTALHIDLGVTQHHRFNAKFLVSDLFQFRKISNSA